MTVDEAKLLVEFSLSDFLASDDVYLLRYNVSERSITHKLSQYLQIRVQQFDATGGWSVDCEYNRNAELGDDAKKRLAMVQRDRQTALGQRCAADLEEETLKEYATYPDIIVHRRGNNASNKIVIEVKKDSSQVDDAYDALKLASFTHPERGYQYTLGAFIKLTIGPQAGAHPTVWFIGGQRQA